MSLSPRSTVCALGLASLGATTAQAQDPPKYFVSTSAFMLMNLVPSDENPSFYQLNFGLRITPRDVLIVEAITWKVYGPIGIPYTKMAASSDSRFPGYLRDVGIGLAYQRFWWRGLYTTLHVTPFVQRARDESGRPLQTGFQLFTSLRFGGHLNVWRDRLFIEPSVAFTHWPVNTNLPASFARVEDQWPNYFLFEPGLNVGLNF